MNAQEKMAQIINYVSDKHPDMVLDKKWNRLLREMSKELEMLLAKSISDGWCHCEPEPEYHIDEMCFCSVCHLPQH